MRKKVISAAVLCFAGSIVLMSNSSISKAAAFSAEEPVAGISLTLDNYYDTTSELSSALMNKIAVQSTDENKTADEQEDKLSKKEKEKQEALKEIKKKYKNLGIAKVDNYLNIREKPGEDKKIIGKLPKNAGCTVYSINKEGWAKIKSGKITGYVMSKPYLVTGKEAEEMVSEVGAKTITVDTTTLFVREKPSTESTILTYVGQGEEFHVLKETKDWVKIEIDQDTGYVSKDYVKVSYDLKKAVADTELKEDVSTGVTSVRAAMVAYAKQFLGKPYVFGGNSLTNGIDCSAFVKAIYARYGYGLSRTSGSQAGFGAPISASSARPGDLIFYGGNGQINHVAMYIGNGQIIHASNPRDGIKISNAFYRKPICARRIIND